MLEAEKIMSSAMGVDAQGREPRRSADVEPPSGSIDAHGRLVCASDGPSVMASARSSMSSSRPSAPSATSDERSPVDTGTPSRSVSTSAARLTGTCWQTSSHSPAARAAGRGRQGRSPRKGARFGLGPARAPAPLGDMVGHLGPALGQVEDLPGLGTGDRGVTKPRPAPAAPSRGVTQLDRARAHGRGGRPALRAAFPV